MRQDHLLSMLSAHQRQTYTLRWTVLGLVLPLLVYAVRALPVLLDPYLPFDTEYTYLPLARRLLENPWLLWKSPDVLQTAPGVFVYMAFAGADLVTLKCWNLALALTTLILLFDAGRRIAGPAAAAAAAWFCAVSPRWSCSASGLWQSRLSSSWLHSGYGLAPAA